MTTILGALEEMKKVESAKLVNEITEIKQEHKSEEPEPIEEFLIQEDASPANDDEEITVPGWGKLYKRHLWIKLNTYSESLQFGIENKDVEQTKHSIKMLKLFSDAL